VLYAFDESDGLDKFVCGDAVVAPPASSNCPLTPEGCDIAEKSLCVWTVDTAATSTADGIVGRKIDSVNSSPKCISGLYAYCCESLGTCNNILQEGTFD